MMWTLEEALPVARGLEKLMAALGGHVALGGSVLHSGGSEKDLDLFIYPHGQDGDLINVPNSIAIIGSHLGVTLIHALDNKEGCARYAGTATAQIYVANLLDGRRIDFFFTAKVLA